MNKNPCFVKDRRWPQSYYRRRLGCATVPERPLCCSGPPSRPSLAGAHTTTTVAPPVARPPTSNLTLNVQKKKAAELSSPLARPSVGAPNEATLPAARSAPSHPSRRRHVRVTGSLLEVRLAHAPGRHDVGRRRCSSSLSAALIHRGRCLTRCRDGHTHTRH